MPLGGIYPTATDHCDTLGAAAEMLLSFRCVLRVAEPIGVETKSARLVSAETPIEADQL
jgi:hypothetical protein